MRKALALLVVLVPFLAPAAAPGQTAPTDTVSAEPPARALALASPAEGAPAAVTESRVADAAESATLPSLPRLGGWVGVAKWLSLGAAAGFGALGFSLHDDANDSFQELTRRCESDPDNCRRRTAGGAYADPTLEALFQDVLDTDRQARASLIAGQVSFAASVAFFIIDFSRGGEPGDIPFDPESEPSRLQLSVLPGELALKYYIE